MLPACDELPELEYPDPEAAELLELIPIPMAHFLLFSTARLASPAATGPMPPDVMLIVVCRKEAEAEDVEPMGGGEE